MATPTKPLRTGADLAATPLASNVVTRQQQLADICCRDTVANRGVGLITGAPGLGKTHAVATFFTDRDLPHVHVEPSSIGRSPKGVLIRLLSAIQPTARPRGTAIELVDELRQLLAEQPRTLIVDEVQRLNVDGLNLLRELHDAPSTDFPLLLVGGAGVQRTLNTDPALQSRVARRAEFRPMRDAELRKAINQLHPLIANTPQEIIDDLDRRLCKGTWRRWVQVAEFVVDRAPQAGHPTEITKQLAHGARAAINKAA